MSWFKPSLLIVLILVTGCGFTPLLAKQSITEQYPAIALSNIPDREGQYLRNQLLDRLAAKEQTVDAPYYLQIDPLVITVTNFGIQKDSTATRGEMQISAEMKLTDTKTQKILLQRTLKSVGGYNILENQYATIVSKQSLTEHLLQEMSATAVTEITLYFNRSKP
jgi:LPS-assembly lipoprotein